MTHVVAAEDRHRLTAPTGFAALGLDALASCAYGPESIVLALAVAGSAGIGFTLPVTVVIVALLGVLVVCYRQVIAATRTVGVPTRSPATTSARARGSSRPPRWSSTTCSTWRYRLRPVSRR